MFKNKQYNDYIVNFFFYNNMSEKNHFIRFKQKENTKMLMFNVLIYIIYFYLPCL